MKRTESQLVFRRAFPNLFSEPLGFRPWGDFQGALVGALVSVPQVLAFGLIIGSALGGPLTGEGLLIALYGAVLLGMAGALFGGCPYLITGPRASAILVFAALIRELAQSEALSHYHDPSAMALALACSAALLSGLLQIAFSLFRFGRLVNYVPLPVMQGFINGSALLIILSQVWAALGIPEQRSYWSVFSHLGEMKPATLLLALGTTASVKFFSRITKKIPPMPLAFIAGTVAYHFAASFGYGADLGGTLPPPPAHFSLHCVAGETASVLFAHSGVAFSVLTAAISMALLSTLDTLLATAATDEITCRRSNADRQLMAEGLGNALAGMFGMAPGSSGLARTKAAIDAGMKSARAPLGVALITLVVVLAFGPMIGRISQAVMAGILISLGLDLLDKSTLSGLRKIGSRGMAVRPDILVVATVVATALFCDLKTAVGVGVLLSVISFVTQMSHSPIRRCYRATALIPRIFGDAARHRFIEKYGRNIAIVEMEGAVFFGTVSNLYACIEKLTSEGVCHVVLDLRRVKHVDATGARALTRINARLEALGGMLVVSHVERERRAEKAPFSGENRRGGRGHRKVWMMLADLGTVAELGDARFQNDTDSAVVLCEKHLAARLAEHEESVPFHSPLIEGVGRGMLRRLRRFMIRVAYQPGDTVFSQGSAPEGVFFVASGRVDVMIDLPGIERKRRVQSLTSGSVFGEMALLDAKPRSASIVVAEKTRCYFMSKENFERLKLENSDIAFSLLFSLAAIFAERLRATNAMLAEMEA